MCLILPQYTLRTRQFASNIRVGNPNVTFNITNTTLKFDKQRPSNHTGIHKIAPLFQTFPRVDPWTPTPARSGFAHAALVGCP